MQVTRADLTAAGLRRHAQQFQFKIHADTLMCASNRRTPWPRRAHTSGTTRREVNSSVVRLGVVEGEYHWHKHADDDEFFYVVEGRLLIELEAHTVELAPRQGVVVPKGVMHRTRAPERTVILMVENAGIVPIGN